jgi:tRNA (mo5U34)-methyltransferase
MIADREAILTRMYGMAFWYHKIRLADGIVTPGLDLDDVWGLIRGVRRHLDYRDKIVLDLGAWDGMWSFEAEALGAALVVAADCCYQPLQNFLFCREILGSRALPYYNVNLYQLQDGLDVFLHDNRFVEHDTESFRGLNREALGPTDRRFDIVQHMGILYHLRDPLMSLIQTRSVMKTGGRLLLETAYARSDHTPMMVFNGPVQQLGRVYHDWTTWWAPNLACLKEMLYASLFRVIDETIEVGLKPHASDDRISRVCLVAEAVDDTAVDPALWHEVNRRFRNAGPRLDFR